MPKMLVLDSNAIIEFVNKKPGAFDLDSLVSSHKCAVSFLAVELAKLKFCKFLSFIVKLETLGFPAITEKEETMIADLLSKLPILPSNESIEAETIKIRRNTKLKLPDTIIAATAVIIGGELVTSDVHFLECTYPALKTWREKDK